MPSLDCAPLAAVPIAAGGCSCNSRLAGQVGALLRARESRERKISEIKSLLINLKT